jgi:hypothetical protein
MRLECLRKKNAGYVYLQQGHSSILKMEAMCSIETLGLFLIPRPYNPERTAPVVYWSEFLATDPEVRVRFPALPYFLRSSGSGTWSAQPREYK